MSRNHSRSTGAVVDAVESATRSSGGNPVKYRIKPVRMFTLSDFDFDLPPELIAQVALPQRSASRLLEVNGQTSPATLADRDQLRPQSRGTQPDQVQSAGSGRVK